MMNQRSGTRTGASVLAEIIILIIKDLRAEFRTSYAVLSAFVFALSLVFITAISFSGIATPLSASVLFWITLYFSVSQFLSRLFVREAEEGTFLLLRMRYGADAVFTAKTIINCAVSAAVCAFLLFLFFFFFNSGGFHIVRFIPAAFAGALSLACSLSLGGALSSMSGGKGGLFAVISIPAAFPILLLSIRESSLIFSGQTSSADAVVFDLAYSAVLFCASLLLFKHLWKS